MKKRLLSLALCLALCLGLFPFGALAANETVSSEDSNTDYVASVMTDVGKTVNYTSLDNALDALKDGDTITLLSDAAVTRCHSLSTAFTLKLNGKTATTEPNTELYIHAQVIVQDNSTGKTGGMAGTSLLNVQPNGDLIIQSGTFGGRITINDGKLTIKGGTFNQEVDLRGGDSDSVFFSGGTFAKIFYLKSSGSFLDLLADGCAFYDNNNQLVNAANSTGGYLYNVKVKEHQHLFTDGACACGYTCPHTSVNESSVCTVCGKQFAASITKGEDVTYYDTFGSALSYATRNDGCTLKLLADVTGMAVMINNPFIFDLNGHSVDVLSVDAKATIKDSGTTKGRIGKVTVSDTKVPGLTLGGLLEEGYAFKYGNGYWANDSYLQTTEGSFVTVEKAPIQSVNVYAKDKNNKEVSTTIAYGTTGEVTLVSSCQLSETSGENLSCAWYKLTDDAAIPPLEGAAGTSYKLPADLPAGTHTYLVTFTSDYYSKSAEITITVTPISLEGAEVTVQNPTYNGKPQEPKVTVKLGDKTLSRDNDYTMDVTKQTDAGSYKLTIKGGGNYSGTIEKDWKIEPVKIDSVMVSTAAVISKVYDGTAKINMTAEEWAGILEFRPSSASATVAVPIGAYTISDACFLEDRDNQWVDSPEAGKKSAIAYTVTFNNSNYVLQNDSDKEPAASKEYMQSGGANFTIRQANVTSPGEITQLVFNDLAKTYTLNLAALLPELSEGCEYGKIQYQGCNYHFTDNTYLDSSKGMSVSNEGILTLPTVSANTSDVNTQIGTITVPVVTTNYQNFEFTIKVVISARIPLNASGVTVSASEITYGQTLNESKLTATGTMKHPGTGEEVKGTFAWTNPEAKPGAAGDYTASWTFTPAEGYEEYATATGTVTVKVKPAKLTVSVKASRAYYTGEAQIASIIASGQSVDSTPVTFTYSDKVDGNYTSDGPTFTDAGTYTAYYKAEAANHEPATGTFTVTIDPLPISLLSVSSISKTYDGSADVTLTADKLTFFSKTASRQDITLPNTALTFSDAQFTSKQEDGSYLPSPEVGGGKALSFTMTLTSNNYVFEGKSEGTTEVSDVFATDDVNRFTITKAAAPTDIQTGTLNVVNGTKLEYTYDAKQLLPKAPKGTYGKVSYNCEFPFNLKNGYYVDDIAIKDNILTLTIDALNGGETGKIGTIPVYVTTDNYASFNLPLDLYAVNKITPVADGEITAAGITYGDALSKSEISGKMKDPNTGDAVNGTFTWTDGTIKPDANDRYEAEWTFTPAAGYEKYATATGTVTIKVNKATPTFTAPTAQENLTYTGREQALITAGSVTSGGTMQYSLTENGTYSQDIPAGTNAGAYTVWYRVIGDANHNDTAPASVVVSIGKKPLTITGVTAASKPYDGTTNAGITSVTFNNVTLTRDTDYTVTASFDDASVGSGKNVTATVTLMGQAAKNYALEQSSFFATGSIIKAAPTYTPPTANDLTYNGTAQELFKAGTTQDGTMLYSMSKTSDFLPDVPLITRAGTYTFYYQVQGDSNHTDSNIGTITATIKKATLTITAKDKSAYVGSTAPDLSNPELNKDYTVSGLFGRDQLTKSPVLSYATEKPDMSPVGSVDINISDADAGPGRNYTITYVSGKLNITTRPSSSGSSNSGTKTDTVKNPDGSTTKTETKADGSKTETTTASSGGGSTGTTVTKTDAKGNTTTEASAKLSDQDVKEAQEKGEAVTVPVKEIEAAKDANAATKIKIDVPNNADKTTVEIPVENVTSGTVAVIVHEDGTEELVKDSKPTEGGVQLELSGSTTVKIIDNSKTFDDTKDHWSRDEVNFVAARELFNGVGGNQFGVSQPMTRGMVNTVLARLAGVDTTPSQGQAWYEVGTDWAKKNGISDGTDPTAPVTREQLATLLYRYAGSPSVSGTLHAADAASVSDYAKDALLWANQNGIVNGVGSNTIAPKDNAQRAQVAAMLARYLQNQ